MPSSVTRRLIASAMAAQSSDTYSSALTLAAKTSAGSHRLTDVSEHEVHPCRNVDAVVFSSVPSLTVGWVPAGSGFEFGRVGWRAYRAAAALVVGVGCSWVGG